MQDRISRKNTAELAKYVGWKLADIYVNQAVSEGGLTLVLVKPGPEPETHHVVFGYTELGEWVEYAGPPR